MRAPEEIADGVYRLGTDWVNWYACVGDDGLVIVDTGLRAYRRQLAELLRHLGRPAADVGAIVLTHYHPDHAGSAEALRSATGARVLAPAGDAEGLRSGKVPIPPRLLASLWRPAMLRYGAHIVGSGGLLPVRIGEVGEYRDGELLELPVALRAVAAPGHTAGHSALLAEERGVLFAGDALANVDFFNRREAVRLLTFNEDTDAARQSLRRIETLEAEVVAFGHGPPLRAAPAEVVARAG